MYDGDDGGEYDNSECGNCEYGEYDDDDDDRNVAYITDDAPLWFTSLNHLDSFIFMYDFIPQNPSTPIISGLISDLLCVCVRNI